MAKKWQMPFLNGKPLFWIGEANWAGPMQADAPKWWCVSPSGEGCYANEDEIEWKDNSITFDATITLASVEGSNWSAKHLLVTDEAGTKYVLFVKDILLACIAVGCAVGGKITAKWKFCKRGQNFGIKCWG